MCYNYHEFISSKETTAQNKRRTRTNEERNVNPRQANSQVCFDLTGGQVLRLEERLRLDRNGESAFAIVGLISRPVESLYTSRKINIERFFSSDTKILWKYTYLCNIVFHIVTGMLKTWILLIIVLQVSVGYISHKKYSTCSRNDLNLTTTTLYSVNYQSNKVPIIYLVCCSLIHMNRVFSILPRNIISERNSTSPQLY